VKRPRACNRRTALSDRTICPVSRPPLRVRHSEDRHRVRLRIVSIDKREGKPLHEVPTIGFIHEGPALRPVENVVNRDLELSREIPRSRG